MEKFQETGDKVKSSTKKKEEGKEGKKYKDKEKDSEEDSFEKMQPIFVRKTEIKYHQAVMPGCQTQPRFVGGGYAIAGVSFTLHGQHQSL